MSTSDLVHNDTFYLDGTNYHLWRLRMLCHFRAMGQNALGIVLVGISIAKGGPSPSIDDMLLDCEVSLAIPQTVTFEVFKSISACKSVHEAWTKLDEIYGGSNLDEDNRLWEELMEELSTFLYHEELSIASTSDYLDTSTSSTSPTCGVPLGNDMVSEEIFCDDSAKLISDDMLALPCCHDGNALVSSSCSVTNHVEEIKKDEARLIDEELSSPKE